jgi:competence ComEA-like helix-hairpin-helix protein
VSTSRATLRQSPEARRAARRHLRFIAALALLGALLALTPTGPGAEAPPPVSPDASCGPAVIQVRGRVAPLCVGDGIPVAEAMAQVSVTLDCRLLDFDAAHRLRPWARVRLRDGGSTCQARFDPLPGWQRLALGGRIPVNHASAEDLTALPGVGPSLAARITTSRVADGVFTNSQELLRVKGIGPKLLTRLQPLVRFD